MRAVLRYALAGRRWQILGWGLAMFLLAVPEPAHATIFTMFVPLRRVDMSAGVERSHEFVTMPRRAGREFLRAGEI